LSLNSNMLLNHISQIEHTPLTVDSVLAELPHYAFQVDVDTLVREVDTVFKSRKNLLGVTILENRRAVGVISRRKFYEQLGQLYGVAVYLNRPIRLVLRAIGGQPLLLSADCLVIDAARLALERPATFVYEPIIFESAPGQYRLVDVYTLLIAQSRLLGNLQDEMRQANQALEARVALRTAELTWANDSLTAEVARRKQIEDALIIARDQALDASRFKSELLANVSHELRTPLGGILGTAEMLQVGVYGALSKPQTEITGQIIKNTLYLTDLVNHLLDQAKLDAGRLKLNIHPFSPHKVVEETINKVRVTAQQKNLALHVDVDAQVPASLLGDSFRIEQILLNLVSNAVKFTEHGSVQVRLFCPAADQWAIVVKDTGPGIPPEAHTLIFEPFGQVDRSLTRGHSGTGLGLSIVKQLTSIMGGIISLDSAVGQGSKFTVTLPLQAAPEES